MERERYYVQPGFIFVSRDSYLLHTVLGSCVAVCLWDQQHKFGGMNHYIYANPFKNVSLRGNSSIYGTIAIPYMMKLLIKLGAKFSDLRAHIVGGAHNSTLLKSPVGKENIQVAEKLLAEMNIPVVTRDIGGELGRKIIFDTESGEILIFKVNNIRKEDWYEQDKGFDYR